MLKSFNKFILVFFLIFTSVIVFSDCEKPFVVGNGFYGAHVESLCDASMSTSTEFLDDDEEAFVVSASVDHYENTNSSLSENGYYYIEANAIYSDIINMQIERIVATDSKAEYYNGECSETATARLIYRNPDFAEHLHGEGEAKIWGERKTFHSENMRRYIYDHDEDILGQLEWI